MKDALESTIESYKDTIKHLIGSYAFNKPIDVLRQRMQYVDELERRCTASLSHRVAMLSHTAESMTARMNALNPRLALKRGYAVVRSDGAIVGSTAALSLNDSITVEMSDGAVHATVNGIEPLSTHNHG